jgi:hypothetical protein
MIEDISPEQVRRVTQSVLGEPEFQKSVNWVNLVFEGFRNFLLKISEWAASNPDMAKVLMIVLGVVLALLLGHIAYTIIREFVSMRANEDTGPLQARPLQALEGIASNWSDAFQLAKAALEAGDIYRALWITHRVLLSAMDRMELLRFARWKTNRDYLRECRSDHAASKTLADVSDAYERVVYAHHSIHSDQAASLLNRVEALVEEANR